MGSACRLSTNVIRLSKSITKHSLRSFLHCAECVFLAPSGSAKFIAFWCKKNRRATDRPTIVAVQVIVADSHDTAAQLAENVQIWGVELENGQRVTVASEEQALAFAVQAGSSPRKIARRELALLHGTAQEVMVKLNALHTQFGIDEFIIDTPVAEGHARLTSLRLLAQVHNAVEVL